MSESKQTAVEWLYDNLKSHFEHDGDLLEVVHMSFEQAKAMQKEQTVTSWYNGWLNQSPMIDEDNCGEQYYNETYRGGKQ